MGTGRSDRTKDDIPTLLAVGGVVSVVASLAHELVGHGLGCVMEGGRITLLTFLVFRCDGAGVIADGAGPFGALAVALASLSLLARGKIRSPPGRLFLLTLGSLTLLWFFGQMMREAVDGSDDWGHVARDLGWPASWHVVLASVGVLGYIAGIRWIRRLASPVAEGRKRRLVIPWVAAVISAVVLGSLWHGDRTGSALDGFLTFGLAPFGYGIAMTQVGPASGTASMQRDLGWLVAGCLCWIGFACTIACGVGSLST